MRCPDCNKFVSYGEQDPEVESEQIDDEGNVTAEISLVLPCGECGTELKSAYLTFEGQVEHDCPEPDTEVDGDVYTLDDVTATFTSREQTHDRHGKLIKNYRYRRTYYGAEVVASATCNRCGQSDLTAEGTVEEQASGFEELV